jgi:alkylhydroperoxidase/carboxymuconolactone decarboxylase family protein YurZ
LLCPSSAARQQRICLKRVVSAIVNSRQRLPLGRISSEEHAPMSTPDGERSGPWDPIANQLRAWDPEGAALFVKFSTNPWINGILPVKTIELICVALSASCTNLQPNALRRHLRAALRAGASRDEILTVFKMSFGPAIHSCSLGAPILLAEASKADVEARPKEAVATPACDAMRALGQWNTAWDPFFDLDPEWTEEFFAFGVSLYQSDVFTQKEVELFSIALDASYTHMYAPGTQRHIRTALALGASMEEIMEVLKLCVVQGVEACNLGLSIFAEEVQQVDTKEH